MKFVLLTLASAHEKWADQATDLYLSKIGHFSKIEIVELKPSKTGRALASQKVIEESEKILDFLTTDDYVVLFDEKGESLDSLQFAKKIETIQNSGKKRAVFIIGGAFGVGDSIKNRANLKISLSKMVFNHLVAQTVVLEQIYRAFTINKNLPYHNI